MGFPIRTCVVCGDEFELRPDKPGFANRCPMCSVEEEDEEEGVRFVDPYERRTQEEMNAARRKAIRDLLYRQDS